MKTWEKTLLVVAVVSVAIVAVDIAAAHAGGTWMCDLLWWIRR